MKRVNPAPGNPEEAVRLHEMDAENDKASAKLNTIINVAAFMAIVGALRIGKSLLIIAV